MGGPWGEAAIMLTVTSPIVALGSRQARAAGLAVLPAAAELLVAARLAQAYAAVTLCFFCGTAEVLRPLRRWREVLDVHIVKLSECVLGYVATMAEAEEGGSGGADPAALAAAPVEVPVGIAAGEYHRARRALAGFMTAFQAVPTTGGRLASQTAADDEAAAGSAAAGGARDPTMVQVPCELCGEIIRGLFPDALEQHMAEHHPPPEGGGGGGGGGA